MKAEYINPFLNATKNLFKTTFGFEPAIEKPFLMESLASTRWEISAELVLSGAVNAALAIRMTKFLSSKLLEKSGILVNDEFERQEMVYEMVKEMTNIIAGNAAEFLSQQNIRLSVPFITHGTDQPLPWPKNAVTIGIPFNTPYGPFILCFGVVTAGASSH